MSRFPEKSPDSRSNFGFVPKKRLLELSPPVFLDLKKRKAPTARDQPTAKWARKVSKRQLSTRLGASEEDKQLLTEQLTNAQDMVKKLRTENLSLKIKCETLNKPGKIVIDKMRN